MNLHDTYFPNISCLKHPQYQVNMICISKHCSNRGPICGGCLLGSHNHNGPYHTFSDIIMLGDALAILKQNRQIVDKSLAQQQQQVITQSIRFQESILDLNTSIIQRLKQLYEQQKQENFMEYKENIQEQQIQSQQLQLTPTDDGTALNQDQIQQILNHIDPNRAFITQMKVLSENLYIEDGQLKQVNKEDQNTSLDEVGVYYGKLINKISLKLSLFDSFIENKFSFGIKLNVPFEQMVGWQMAYQKSYSAKTSSKNLDDTFSLCNEDDFIAIGALNRESNTIVIMAIDTMQEIAQRTTSSVKSRKSTNSDIHWYYVRDKSFGFTDIQDIDLQDGDIMDNGKRLSWNINGDGGFRADLYMELYKTTSMDKIIMIWKKQ